MCSGEKVNNIYIYIIFLAPSLTLFFLKNDFKLNVLFIQLNAEENDNVIAFSLSIIHQHGPRLDWQRTTVQYVWLSYS